MMGYLQNSALIEMSISCSVVLMYCLQQLFRSTFPMILRIALIVILGNAFFWPLGFAMALPLAAYVRGVTGDLSIVTTLLLWSSVIGSAKPCPNGFKVFIVALALLFYPFALGLGMIDPYAWGYHSFILLLGVVCVAIVWGVAGWVRIVWIIALALMAWSVQWHESRNLWDYLFDPFLVFWALGSLIQAWRYKRREKAQSGYLFRAG